MLKRILLAAFALVIYPILTMLSSNTTEVSLDDVIQPLLVSLLVTLLLMIILRLVLRRWDKVALVTSFILVLFYSYSHVYSLLEQHPVAGFTLERHRSLIILYALGLITPVNSFRLIINTYFGTNHPLLPDVSYNQSDQPVPQASNSCVNK